MADQFLPIPPKPQNPHSWNETIIQLYGLDEAPPAVVNRDQFPDATKMVPLSDRIARALCVAMAPDRDGDGARPCSAPCATCRNGAAAAAHEIAAHFSELYGGASATADALYAVGTHQPELQAEWQPIDPGKEAMAIAITRELRRPDV